MGYYGTKLAMSSQIGWIDDLARPRFQRLRNREACDQISCRIWIEPEPPTFLSFLCFPDILVSVIVQRGILL